MKKLLEENETLTPARMPVHPPVFHQSISQIFSSKYPATNLSTADSSYKTIIQFLKL